MPRTDDAEDSSFALQKDKAAKVMRRLFKAAEIIRCQVVDVPDDVTVKVITPRRTYRYVRKPSNVTLTYGTYVSVLNPGGESQGKVWEIINVSPQASSAAGVSSLNGLSGIMNLLPGTNVQINQVSNDLRINALPSSYFFTYATQTYNTGGAIEVEQSGASIEPGATLLDFTDEDFEVTSAPAGQANIFIKRYDTVSVYNGATGAQTIAVNNTSYTAATQWGFATDLDWFPFTHYRIVLRGNSSQAAQTITLQLATAAAPTTPINTGGDDLVVTNTTQVHDSGWLTRDDAATGLGEYVLALKGSNGTVDLSLHFIDILLKCDR